MSWSLFLNLRNISKNELICITRNNSVFKGLILTKADKYVEEVLDLNKNKVDSFSTGKRKRVPPFFYNIFKKIERWSRISGSIDFEEMAFMQQLFILSI